MLQTHFLLLHPSLYPEAELDGWHQWTSLPSSFQLGLSGACEAPAEEGRAGGIEVRIFTLLLPAGFLYASPQLLLGGILLYPLLSPSPVPLSLCSLEK